MTGDHPRITAQLPPNLNTLTDAELVDRFVGKTHDAALPVPSSITTWPPARTAYYAEVHADRDTLRDTILERMRAGRW